MKVRVFKDYDASVSGLKDGMSEGADPREHAVATLRNAIINGIYDGAITGNEFHYVVLPEPIILEEEDYPGEQFELLRKIFGVPGATVIRIEDYAISAFVPSSAQEKPETCRERLMREHPSAIKPNGRCKLCPHIYGYLPKDTHCIYKANGYVDCNACWDRPVEEVNR